MFTTDMHKYADVSCYWKWNSDMNFQIPFIPVFNLNSDAPQKLATNGSTAKSYVMLVLGIIK